MMTSEEKEIRDAERKVMANALAVKRKISKKLSSMSDEEWDEYIKKQAERYRAESRNVAG